MNKVKTNNRKITEFFQSNNNLSVSRVGIPHKNNTYNISKDSNNTNTESKYDRVSKKIQISGKQILRGRNFKFSEYSSESGTLSLATNNSIIEGKYYPPHPVLQIERKPKNSEK